MSLDLILENFGAINANAFYSILYFLQNNLLFFIIIFPFIYKFLILHFYTY